VVSKTKSPAVFIGVDMAWGEKNPDGLCCLIYDGNFLDVYDITLARGDSELLGKISEWIELAGSGVIAVDAPLIIKNRRGMRPVDRLTHELYRKQHAGCHPAYLDKIQRPVRFSEKLAALGIPTTPAIQQAGFSAIEVYPHISMLHAFGLGRILKYKKGSVAQRGAEFKKYQKLLKRSLVNFFEKVRIGECLEIFLSFEPWSKSLEDQTDGLFCALIGWHHWFWRGTRSEVLGDDEYGFIVSCRENNNSVSG
jgi:predicted RNase H-like nuclease